MIEEFIQRRKDWGGRKQDEFEKLSPEKKEEEIKKAYDEAQEMKELVDLYVSPEKIVPGLETKEIARLSELFKNKPIQDIGKARRGSIGDNLDVAYTQPFYSFLDNKEKLKQLQEYFKNMPVIDLGAGSRGSGYCIAKILGASGYVGVEPHVWGMLEDGILLESIYRIHSKAARNYKDIPFAIVPEDALTFLKRIPNHSVGIMTFGTDTLVLGRECRTASDSQIQKYVREVMKEISRTLHPKSAFISSDSAFYGFSDDLSNNKELSNSDLSVYSLIDDK